ncbi:hypothetical protein [Niallia sp. BSM11]|uniref:hypothetical protein n=1 Tax=Niallia sp. BSM11 TaxID=3391576 RepID=UPI003984D2D9
MKTILACFFILILMGSISCFAKETIDYGNYEVDLPEKELTLKEAYNLGLELGKKFDKEAILLFMNSVDDETLSGYNGKKGNWQGVFALPSVKRQMVFVIEKGKHKSHRIIGNSDELTIPHLEINIDSSQIIKNAVEKYHLQPSPKDAPFSHGYHFRLMRDENYIFLGVDGKINGLNAEVLFNPKTGEYLGLTKENK